MRAPLAFVIALATSSVPGASVAVASAVTARSIQLDALQHQHVELEGEAVAAWSTHDKHGDHLLVLSKAENAPRTGPAPERIERIDLKAGYYRKRSQDWVKEWTIKDFVDCPGLDSGAGFFIDQVTITDLNGDGIAEITVPYKMFCGGGIDTAAVKVIMRQGKEKLAIRGESLVVIPGAEPFGGNSTPDKTLELPQNAIYKRHLDDVWQKVYVHRYQK